MDQGRHPWQDTAHVLSRFGRSAKAARRTYREFGTKRIAAGKRPDLVGGGLVRSMGGWVAVMAQRKAKVYMKCEERILGASDFVEPVLVQAQEAYERKQALQAKNIDPKAAARRVAVPFNIDVTLENRYLF